LGVRWLCVLSLIGVAASGCGGSDGGRSSEPRLPSAIATSLALQSRGVATSLEQGDACTAQTRLQQLTAEVQSPVVRPPFRRPLLLAVSDLARRMPQCVPPEEAKAAGDEPPAGPGKAHGQGKGHGKHKGKGHKEGGDGG
jgi:hypothetical protein